MKRLLFFFVNIFAGFAGLGFLLCLFGPILLIITGDFSLGMVIGCIAGAVVWGLIFWLLKKLRDKLDS